MKKGPPNVVMPRAQVISHWILTRDAQVQVQANPRKICGGESGIQTGFSPSRMIIPCQCPSINASYSSPTLYNLGN